MAVMYRDPTASSADGYDVRHLDDLVVGNGPWWPQAEPIAWGPPASQTTFRAAWTADALLVRFDAVDAHPWHTIAERDGELWNEEVVELFLDPDGSGRNYAEFEVNPAGTICDLVVRTPWPSLLSDRSWNCAGVTAWVTMVRGADAAPGGWTVELVIPWGGLATLGAHAAQRTPPRRGDCWRFNVFRIDRPHGQAEPERDAVYAAWSVPAGPSFHDTNAFRDLRFR
jgi:hypothetical protein